ncbi:DUF349 domain-containing protein [uncultured Jatrophihabitans sp.]|uniref:DUF349 domain-containing protein n=1 Tax=uncultured Jatrophihabitans sp. TaxID=1610747 RepID=UPI0035CAFDDD
MSSEWGRIDADGTVYVRAGEGERAIGSWQAGDVEAGIAFYTRRFDDLEAEVRVLEKRLESGAGDPASSRKQAQALQGQLPEAAVIGNLAALDERLTAVIAAAHARTAEASEQREQARAGAIAAKEALAAEAEKIAESATSWKASGDRLRAIVDEWRAIKGVDRKTDDALWKRFSTARDAFGRRRGQHFAQLDTERGAARDVKERLIARAEELSTSTEWRETAAALRDLLAEWKAAGRAARDVEDALWKRFRAAQDTFFHRRSEVFAERDAEQLANQKTKEQLIAAARGIDISDPKAAQAALRDVQERYDAVGHVPRDAMRRLDDQMRAAEQRVRDAADAQWRAAGAASNPFLAALRDRLTEAEAKLERARNSGDAARIRKAEDDVAQRRALLPDD